MTYGEIEKLLEEEQPLLCSCGSDLYLSLMQRSEGYLRLRCPDCDTDVLLARWVLDCIANEGAMLPSEARTRLVLELAQFVCDLLEESLKEVLVNADDSAILYALLQLARIAIPQKNGEYDSCGIRLFADVLWELAKSNRFVISQAAEWRVVGKFIRHPPIFDDLEAARAKDPEVFRRIDRAIEEVSDAM